MTEPFAWRECGEGLVVDTVLGGGLLVRVTDDQSTYRAALSVELPPRAVDELEAWLVGSTLVHEECVSVHELGIVEEERDAILVERDKALRKVEHLEHLADALQAKLTEVEQRAHGFERDVERMRAAGQPVGPVRLPSYAREDEAPV